MANKIPDAYNDDFYDWIDNTLDKSGLVIPGKHPHGAKTVGKQIEGDLYQSLKRKINGYLASISENAPQHEVYHEIMSIVKDWQDSMSGKLGVAFDDLYLWGMTSGIVDAGIKPAMGLADKLAMEFIKINPKRIGERINQFSQTLVDKFREVIVESYTPTGIFDVGNLVSECGKIVTTERYKLERIVRTETASISNYGRILGWERDEYKDYYNYNWNASPDNRVKPISMWRMKNNPYTFDEIKFLWENQEQFILGKWFNDVFNQRCSISRSPREEKYTGNRFEGNTEFRQTM